MDRTFNLDRRGQSEVIGSILAVAIVIVLAAAVGGYVFDLYDRQTSVGPQVSFTYTYNDSSNELTVTHESGDKFDGNRVTFVCQSGTCTGYSPEDWSSDATVTAGDDETIEGVSANDAVLIVWKQPRQDGKTVILDEWEGPEA